MAFKRSLWISWHAVPRAPRPPLEASCSSSLGNTVELSGYRRPDRFPSRAREHFVPSTDHLGNHVIESGKRRDSTVLVCPRAYDAQVESKFNPSLCYFSDPGISKRCLSEVASSFRRLKSRITFEIVLSSCSFYVFIEYSIIIKLGQANRRRPPIVTKGHHLAKSGVTPISNQCCRYRSCWFIAKDSKDLDRYYKMAKFSFFRRESTGRRLIFNLTFWGGHAAIFAYGWHSQVSNPNLFILNLLKFSVWTSRGAGIVLGVDGFLLLLPVCRNLITFLRPQLAWLMPLDENLWFHRQVAYSTAFFSMVHTTAHYVNMFMVEKTQVRANTAVGIMYTQTGPFTGHVMLVIMVLMYTTAHHSIRKQCFEAFWYTHHLAFFWLLGLYTHATGCFVRGGLPGKKVECFGYNTVRFTLISGALYFGERVWREVRARRETQIVGVLMHPSGTMEIRFRKPGFKYVPGQWLFLQVAEVSKWQWHPFTISSAPDDPYISIHIRQVGDFTKAVGESLGATSQLAASLSEAVRKGKSGENPRNASFVDITGVRNAGLPLIRIDGPYGAPAEDVFGCEMAILVGAGIGVTPFSSILKNIYYMQQKGNLGSLRRVNFIWINKDIAAFGWFRALLQNLEDMQTDKDFLTMNMYLTGKLDLDTIANIALNDTGAEFDPLTGLKARTHFGRPQWADIFERVKIGILEGSLFLGQESSLRTKVGVFCCGPNALAKTLKEHCRKATTSQVAFEFYKEHF
ncbi:hypothetical protein O181_015599 [Austropuccinia psidii MF-1]|uniref:FAD-binding FR-type domain-containing protein n=1 Tax=Austropuccinia psidii MF-1 TaxID=1389203 RepID=A0A9Q3GQZ9_9BASI|nr:hypothetical protein [Austropuccinia psidii MF-1]